ncbi:hypothetical protein NAPIS_ORF00429 [Vairimorpha apis BRL 01]|uniref:Uncharacterized protein n=1 Tax=Vairimorpha apis BRL 01 TaxID=1037528 RepID=T0L3E6_9MICR|nr:hypothetical protein NAPIS_ORF00429 [Vairimorpha apis BRL 01]
MLDEIYPEYKLTTYLVDPINLNMCYLFIENIFSKEVKHYTIFLNDGKSLQIVKNKILCDNILVNSKFDKCFNNFLNFQKEIYEFKFKPIQFHIVKYNDILKIIYSNLLMIVHNVDKTNLVKFNLHLNTELYQFKTIYSMLNNLNIILSISFQLKNSNISILNPPLYDLSNLKKLEILITDRMFNCNNFTLLCFKKKIEQINKMSVYAYYFCIKKNI